MSWSDMLFERQFGMPRDEFFPLCEKLKAHYPGRFKNGIDNYKLSLTRGAAATPDSGPVTMEIKLAITLRIFRGASYLDMIWYGVQLSTVSSIFSFVIELIDSVLPNNEIFNFDPESENFHEECARMAGEWSSIMIAKKGVDGMKGTIVGGDGLVIAIGTPTDADRDGLPVTSYFNRKGCMAINAQGFCDAWCRFRYFDVSWPGSTNDITAYKQTKMYSWWMRGLIPSCYHMVLDEAYSSIGGDNHLTPFTKAQLKKARAEDFPRYLKMRAFNNTLSSQRITVERAFGLLIRKWGILWKPLAHSLRVNTLIVIVCVKLHNVCVNHWKKKGHRAEDIMRDEASFQQQRDAGVFMGWEEQHLYDDYAENFDDEQVRQIFGNHLPNARANPTISKRKEELVAHLYNAGIRCDPNVDRDFQYRDD